LEVLEDTDDLGGGKGLRIGEGELDAVEGEVRAGGEEGVLVGGVGEVRVGVAEALVEGGLGSGDEVVLAADAEEEAAEGGEVIGEAFGGVEGDGADRTEAGKAHPEP
jgi:hypothetical protein